MLDHVSITVTNIGAAEKFYDALMSALGIPKVRKSELRLGYGERCDGDHPDRNYLSIKIGDQPDNAPARHWCFKAPSRAPPWMHFGRPEGQRGNGQWFSGRSRRLPRELLRGLPNRSERKQGRGSLPLESRLIARRQLRRLGVKGRHVEHAAAGRGGSRCSSESGPAPLPVAC